MKKEFMASVLTLTAGMASTISFPEYALARSNGRIEQSYSKKFQLKLNAPARYTDHNGRVVQGHIYLNLDQTPFTPSGQNQLHGEMSGYLFFQSDDYTEVTREGEKYKTFASVVGDDGEALLDLVHKSSEEGRRYQIYGCNSTLTYCDQSEFSVTFGGTYNQEKVKMDFAIPESLGFEVLTPQTRRNEETGKIETYMDWSRYGSIEMVLSNVEI